MVVVDEVFGRHSVVDVLEDAVVVDVVVVLDVVGGVVEVVLGLYSVVVVVGALVVVVFLVVEGDE